MKTENHEGSRYILCETLDCKVMKRKVYGILEIHSDRKNWHFNWGLRIQNRNTSIATSLARSYRSYLAASKSTSWPYYCRYLQSRHRSDVLKRLLISICHPNRPRQQSASMGWQLCSTRCPSLQWWLQNMEPSFNNSSIFRKEDTSTNAHHRWHFSGMFCI